MEVVHSNSESPHAPSPGGRRRWRRWLGWGLLALVVCLVAAELVARYSIGLGDPPLWVGDPQMKYLLKPSQEVRRFGNRVHVNAHSMRSDEFPARKTDPRELRVLVIGDSVIYGGPRIDQSDLATTILRQKLRERLGRPVVVGNVGAPSWSPVSMLAYVRAFGLFDADVVAIVVSSHDYAAEPAGPYVPVVGVLRDLPDRRPVLAIQEILQRYGWDRIREQLNPPAPAKEGPPEQIDIDRSLNALTQLIGHAQDAGAHVIVAQHLERQEMSGRLLAGHASIESTARQAGAQVVQIGPAQRQSLRRGQDPHRDAMHPNPTGQRIIADVLFEAIVESSSASAPAPNGIGQ